MNENIIHHQVQHPESEQLFADVYELKIKNGASVFAVLPHCSIGAEAMAMIQALSSRSPATVLSHLHKVAQKGPEAFMETFYKGYGDKSIGDLGHVLLVYEGVSMLAAKAIQDCQLYAGQESSTRYIDFSKQSFLDFEINPEKISLVDSKISGVTGIQEQYRDFYLYALPEIKNNLYEKYPWEDQKGVIISGNEITEDVYERSIKARSFDIARGFLPAGAATNVFWYSAISTAVDHLGWLRCHALDEVQELADKTQELLDFIYPSSFLGRKIDLAKENYKKDFYLTQYYLEEHSGQQVDFYLKNLSNYKQAILTRPFRQELHYTIGECGTLEYNALLDFASFRDQQRHRSFVQRQGLLTDKYGFHEWYIDNLPDKIHEEAIELLQNQSLKIEQTGLDKFQKQYLFPMGMKIPTRIVGHLGKIFYFLELRCQKTVHPTLYTNTFFLASEVKQYLAQELGVVADEIPMYIDPEVGGFSLKRGTQTILENGKEMIGFITNWWLVRQFFLYR
ncbi:MAG TPA: hypothetical protein PKC14_02350 [Candidatus Absconditabacterales bacterium]|nr:hypothetical protein [Candidatus Absconditabacterales bacterium]